MSDHCGSVTTDGNDVCIPSLPSQASACGCSSEAKTNAPALLSVPFQHKQEKTMWKKIRSGLMFGIACVASPCCTPIIVPLGLALLAGTPIAIWLSANIGWVYGGLTLLSIVSLVLGFRWVSQKTETKSSIEAEGKTTVLPVHEIGNS